jgi:hypothetical protein
MAQVYNLAVGLTPVLPAPGDEACFDRSGLSN